MQTLQVENILRLRIMSEVYRKMFHYVNATPIEVSGFGKVKIKGSNYDVTDIKIFKQNGSAGGTTIKADTLAKFLSLLARKGKKLEDWKLWWHSHPNFEAHFSPVDTNTISELSNGTVLISLCINQLGDMVARKDGIGGYRRLETVIIPNEKDGLKRNCVREARRKVNEEVIVNVPNFKSIYSAIGLDGYDVITV